MEAGFSFVFREAQARFDRIFLGMSVQGGKLAAAGLDGARPVKDQAVFASRRVC
ncbi:hypothetical protein SAMN05519105_1557 [Rhodobacter sp. 24-YEA-8]|nr:hypothetical protein SAMN05519105_1557 [Rhodobacter sp. 24-YEA-8]